MEIVLVFLCIVLFVIFLKYYLNTIDFVSSSHHSMFEELQFSTQEFYSITESLISYKGIAGVRTSRVNHSVAGIFSGKREYLRVTYKEYFFDVCAAPFAKDFFVSWRQGQLSQIVTKKRRKTFYEEDTELMFKESIRLCVNRAIDEMKEHKGIRKEANEPLPLLQ